MKNVTYLKTLTKLLLLLVYDSQSEIDLVRLVEVGLHLHDLRECLLSMLKRPIAVVQDADAVPKTRLLRRALVRRNCQLRRLAFTDLGVLEIYKSALISRVGLLQVIHHKITVA